MTQKNNGGPAFPKETITHGYEGMTLLDFFAASVRQSMGTWTPHVPAFVNSDNPFNRTMGELEEAQSRARAEW